MISGLATRDVIVCCQLFSSRRRVQLFMMDAEDEDDDDCDDTTTTTTHDVTNSTLGAGDVSMANTSTRSGGIFGGLGTSGGGEIFNVEEMGANKENSPDSSGSGNNQGPEIDL